jgi:hypothetical protein
MHVVMNQSHLRSTLGFALMIGWAMWAAEAAEPAASAAPNQPTDTEKVAGGRLLFDGKTTAGWQGANHRPFPQRGWVVDNGCLKHLANGGGGDIVTTDQFTDFEFDFEWRLGPGANSGVKYLLRQGAAGVVGHEYQLWDQPGQDASGPPNKGSTASFYDVLPPKPHQPLRPPGQFNHSRILVQGQHVEHWLNGEKVLEYELGSEAVKAAVAASKFKAVTGFGTRIRTSLLLQDHGGEVWFRNLKLRARPAE